MKRNYEDLKKDIAKQAGISLKDIDVIDKIQFEFLRKMMQEKKSVRLPSFGIFMLKKNNG